MLFVEGEKSVDGSYDVLGRLLGEVRGRAEEHTTPIDLLPAQCLLIKRQAVLFEQIDQLFGGLSGARHIRHHDQ